MCQQTGVAAVVPYYLRFLEDFPDLQALAGSSEDRVIRLWEGLGYYSRARNLRRAAQIILESHGGQIPPNREDLLRLPGIGPYSAGAILAIAFSKAEPALDGNLIRVFTRYFGETRAVDEPEVLKDLWRLAQNLVPQNSSDVRAYTEGLMDLGASICRPKNPACVLCPLKKHCQARARGSESQIPFKNRRMLRLKKQERIFIQTESKRVLVMAKGADPKFPHFHRLPFLEGLYRREGFRKMKYSVTNRDFEVQVIESRLPQSLRKQCHWLNWEEVQRISFPAIDRKILNSVISQTDSVEPEMYFREDYKRS
jgi:A/G-specific adenine glycosylase